MTKKYLSLFIITIITLGCSYASALVTRKSNDTWYQSLTKASLSPPDWVFAPVWITLYILMSIAVWKVYDKLKNTEISNAKKIIKLYYVHLLINVTWPIIFFEFQLIFLGFVNIVFLLLFIIILMKLYFNIFINSFYLMIPYFVWVCFAGYLNFEIFRLN